eukprot:11221398-Alexandrium_andersonii.AAC.1
MHRCPGTAEATGLGGRTQAPPSQSRGAALKLSAPSHDTPARQTFAPKPAVKLGRRQCLGRNASWHQAAHHGMVEQGASARERRWQLGSL